MSRRKRRSAARHNDRKSPNRKAPNRKALDPKSSGPDKTSFEGTSTIQKALSGSNPSRPNGWFLAVTILLQIAWAVFLVAMALAG